jgi:hypothetical protein
MLATVDFDNYPSGLTKEVDGITVNRYLAAEFQPSQTPVSKTPPNQLLSIGRVNSKFAGSCHRP